MIRLGAALAAMLLLSAACSSHSDDKSDMRLVHVGAAKIDSTPLRDGDVRIVASDGGIDLALIGDSISSGLSQSALAKAKAETDTSTVKGSGLGASIERMVKKGVQSAIGTRVAFSLTDIKGARYENGRIVFDWVGRDRQIFNSTKVNNKPMLESFAASDAQHFVDAVNARKGAVAK